jgi:hypothetical protein
MSESGGMSVNCLTADGQTVAPDLKANITMLPANLRPAGATIHCCAKKYGVIVGPGTGGEPGPVTSPGQPVEFDCDGCGAGPTRRMNCNVTK